MPAPNDPTLLVLVSLAAGPRHGHAILLDVRDFAGVRLGPGTLYGAISRLEEDGLIEPMPLDGRRRPYRLTRDGRAALADRLGGLNQAIQTGLRRMDARA
ncbi:MAG TPA: helix-turn-helix transcriptional regulator [Candidatus Limnocylindria bacterium]|nr:helix-turn-helix transcriptional regulator [Candidatus Limnocylindria bacterium]